MNNKKGFIVPILLGIIALLVIGGGIYVFKNKKAEVPAVVDTSTQQVNTQTPKPIDTSNVSLKEVLINNNYSIKVPSDFSMTQISSAITNVPNYEFTEPNYKNRFSVVILPILRSNSPIDGKCSISPDFTKVYCEGATLANSFTTIRGQKVFYGTKASDLTLDCTMNSPCPRSVPANERYSITYIFVIDETDNTLIEFYAGDAVRKSSPEVNGFEGVAKLLHDTIIPSFNAIGQD